MKSHSQAGRKINWKLLLVVLSLAVVIVGLIAIFVKPKMVRVDSFATCREVGGMIMESYPEQCTVDGSTFINIDQVKSPSNLP